MLIDREEDRTLRAVLVGMLREARERLRATATGTNVMATCTEGGGNMQNFATFDSAISQFNDAALQLDVTKEATPTDNAKVLRLLALGLKDLADALKQ